MATLPGNLITTPATPRRLGTDGPRTAPLKGGSQGQDAEAAAAAVDAPIVVASIALLLVSTRPRRVIQTRTRAADRAKSRKPKSRNSFSALLDKEVDNNCDDEASLDAELEETDVLVQDFEGLSNSECSMPKKPPFAKPDTVYPIPLADLPPIDIDPGTEDANMTPAKIKPPAKKKPRRL
eukprot:scaffold36205_cov67-Attheya_sp.AAC.3